jgi:hypothetical protein
MSFLNLLTNVAKAGVALVAAPVALVADIVTLPASADDPCRGPFERTGKTLNAAGDCMKEAIKPTKESS